MKYSLPSLTFGVLLAGVASLAAAEASSAGKTEVSGQQLIAEAANRLALQPALAARIRQRANLFGQQLVGSGSYQQLLAEGKTLLRLELKLQVDGQLTSLQQISDGSTLWVRRDEGDQRSVCYVNLRSIRDALRARHRPAPGAISADAIAVGGLPQLLDGLHQNFQFGAPLESTLGNVPVWVIRGRWKTERLSELLPGQKEKLLGGSPPAAAELPAHLPDAVTVVLGRDDFVPLFPYRIEYERQEASADPRDAGEGRAGQGGGPQSMVLMEFFEVRRSLDVPPTAFEYYPGDQPIDNQTDLYLHRLGLLPDAGS